MRTRRSKTAATLLALVFLFVVDSASSQQRGFKPDFQDVDIKEFLQAMATQMDRNILVDESVQGKITVLAYQEIPRGRLLAFLKQVLAVRGFALVEEGDFLKVVATDEARDESLPEEGDLDEFSAGMVTRVLHLPSNVNISELSNIAKNIGGSKTTVVPYRPTNTLVLTGYAANIRRVLEVIGEIIDQLGPDTRTTGGGETVHIYRAKHMTAESLAQVLVRLENPAVLTVDEGEGGEGESEEQEQQRQIQNPAAGGKIKAVAHKESNSIVVTASPAEWSEILSIIEHLDQPRHQILLEVLIAEVTSSSLNDFGIDWRFQGDNSGHSQFNTGLAAEGGLVDTETGEITGNNTLNGFSLGFLERGGDLLAILNANVTNSNFNVLSSPQVLTLDNQEAEINVGQDVPVRTQERTSGGGSSEATVNSFEYRPSGIKLKFTPHVNASGQIGIDLFGEVTSIEGAQNSGTNPTFNKRNIKTFVTVVDKQTIVIGGLVGQEKQHAVRKIPLLGDIPFLGHLFRRTTYDVRRTNLMLFITPHILTNREEADRLTEYKREEQLRAERQRHNEIILWPEREVEGDREADQIRLDELEDAELD